MLLLTGKAEKLQKIDIVCDIQVIHPHTLESRVNASLGMLRTITVGDIQATQLYTLESRVNASLECRAQ
jgi:hypothetical protein